MQMLFLIMNMMKVKMISTQIYLHDFEHKNNVIYFQPGDNVIKLFCP